MVEATFTGTKELLWTDIFNLTSIVKYVFAIERVSSASSPKRAGQVDFHATSCIGLDTMKPCCVLDIDRILARRM